MATISVPNVRVNSDIRFKVTLSDNDVSVDWSSVEELAVILFFRDQRTFGARCTIDDIDGTDLHISYPADRPQFLGIADIVVNCVYQGFEKTFDKPAVNFVDSTAAASGVTNIDDVELEVDIAVAEVDTSILDGAIYAAIKAAMEARNLPYIGDNGHWFLYNTDAESYVDSGKESRGEVGPPGPPGPSSADVTAEAIATALGYMPVAPADIADFITASVNNLVNYYLKSETYTMAEVQALLAGLETALSGKVDKVSGKGLSTNDYDNTAKGRVDALPTAIDGILNALALKQDIIGDLVTIRSGAAAGATAYQKPSGGIPESDLASGVIPDVSGKENTSNKVTTLSAQSTDMEYPSAKCVYDLIGDVDTLLAAI